MNGVETIQALRKALAREIPAVVLTGDIRSEVLDAIAKHNVAVATKPTDPDQLLRLVKQQYASPIILAAVNKPAIGQALHQAPRL